jgi:CopG family nickel-responsive transcriptional regulator
MSHHLTRFGVAVPENLLSKFDRLIKEKGYGNRSKALCDLIRQKIVEQDWNLSDKETVGTITIVYNHSFREIADTLNHLQHHYYSQIISNLHVHLDLHNCLEVLVVKGKVKNIKKISDRLMATKGVKQASLCMAGTGKEL